jgi:tight adherence protein C
MTAVVLLATIVGMGVIGVAYGLRGHRVALDGVLEAWERTVPLGQSDESSARAVDRLGAPFVAAARRRGWATHRWVLRGLADLEITGGDPEAFVSRLVVLTAAGALGPPVLWLLASMAGVPLPSALAAVVMIVTAPTAVALHVGGLVRRAGDRRRHFRVVIGSFVDLVVLSLAGGVGIDGALHAASQVSPDWAAQLLGRTLLMARDSGTAPWTALEALGRDLAVPELVELATTVQLAGTEGARIRQSLTARAASLRRHEQADAESAANAMTERLFLPGALLLLGFLLFIGYPAFQRILGGF